MNNNINNSVNPNSQNIGNVNNGPGCAGNNVRVDASNNVFHMRNDGIMNKRAIDKMSVSSKDIFSFKDLKNVECPRKTFDGFIVELKELNPDAAKRMDFVMNHCAISQAELGELNKIASKSDTEGKASRVVTWIGEEGEILSKDGPAKETSGIMGITKAANSYDLCVGARQLDKEEIDIDVYFDAEGPGGENKGDIDTESLDEAVKHFDNLGFVINKDEIAKKAQALADKGKGPIKIRPLMFNTFGVMSDSALTQALKSGLNALLPADVSGTITKGAKALKEHLEKEQEKADEEGVILIPYITGHSFGGFNATGIAAINGWGSTMFNPLGIGEGVANARMKNKDRLYGKLVELNKNPEKHLIFSTEHDFTSSNINPYVEGAIANGGIFFGEVINVPNKVESEDPDITGGYIPFIDKVVNKAVGAIKYPNDFFVTHCNYRKNLDRNLRELEGMNGSIGWDRNSFEKIFPDSDDGTGKNLQENFEKFGKVKSYSKDDVDEKKGKYKQTIPNKIVRTTVKVVGLAGAIGIGVATLGVLPAVATALGGIIELARESNPDKSRKIIRNTVNAVGIAKEKGLDRAESVARVVQEKVHDPLGIGDFNIDLDLDDSDIENDLFGGPIDDDNLPSQLNTNKRDEQESEFEDSETNDTSDHE